MPQFVYKLSNSVDWLQSYNRISKGKRDVYFSPSYYQFHEQNGDGIAYCFVVEKNDQIAIYPFLKTCINDLGFNLDDKYFDIQGAYGYNGVISNSQQEEFINYFYTEFNAFCKKENIVTEFVRFHPLLNNYKFSKNHLKTTHNRNTVFVNLNQDLDQLFANFSSSTRRAVRRSIKFGLTVKAYLTNFPYKKEFLCMYKETMDRLNSSEYLYFSQKYFDELFASEKVVQFVCFLENKPIASSVCLFSEDYFHYHLGASKQEFLNYRPNNLLFYEMIKYAKAHGHKQLHLGGGKTLEMDDSLLKYKRGFSKSIGDFYVGEKIHNKATYSDIISQWEKANPEKKGNFSSLLLKYRIT